MKILPTTALLLTLSLVACASAAPIAMPPAVADTLAKQDVVWDSPSDSPRGSMPLGNGDIGLNVWVEPTGDLVILMGKSDSFDEFNRLLKIGRVRVRTTPALFTPGQTFSQALRLADGAIMIKSGTTAVRVWVDANHPVAQVDLDSTQPVQVQVLADNWRKENRALSGEGPGANTAWGNWPEKMRVNADTVLAKQGGQIGWCHHNIESQWKKNLEHTALGAEVANGTDPVLNRSFGALVRAKGAQAVSDIELKTAAPVTRFSAQILSLTAFADSPAAWQAKAQAAWQAVDAATDESRLAAHKTWWRGFWNRSWITLDDGGAAVALPANALPWKVGVASDGGSRFGGEIAGAKVDGRALSAAEVAALAAAPRPEANGLGGAPAGAEAALAAGCTLSAWIKPAAGESGRILDKCTAGQPDGLTLDAYPGLSLRWIVGQQVVNAANCLKPGVWQHVAASVDSHGKLAVYLDGKPLLAASPASPTATLARAYTLQRFVTACAGRGALPIKFNGSLFSVDGRDPDFRAWGGGYWFQNTREAYWAMPYAGDYDMMLPLFEMYRKALLLREAATKKYYGHEGAFFPETMYFWGNYMDAENYGLDRRGKPDGMTDNTYIRRYWQSGLELLVMMLDYEDGTQDAAFRDQTLLPYAKSVTTFFDQHWPRSDGKILFEPAQSLETWHTAKNPLPEIAGLRYILPRLLKLPADDATKAMWRKTLADLPPVPTHTDAAGNVRLAPAETYGNKSNMENPELYGVFPYRTYTAMTGGAELEQALNAWRVRRHPEDRGWQQNCIQAALLGLTAEAKAMVEARARSTAGGYRFPGFFGPNYDWTPEQCHGTNMQTALQRMLMQCEGDRIVLLPAWPKAWNGAFKLHAPKNTTVEGRIENGSVVDLKVVPESRRKDVEIQEAK